MISKLPEWLRKRPGNPEQIHAVKRELRKHSVHTVCEEAGCPNLGECFNRKTATFMIMGKVCTRSCGFCGVKSAKSGHEPTSLNKSEPEEVARMVSEMGLRHVVITSVTRDDLPDEGAGHFAATIKSIKDRSQTVEVLTPDFHARADCLETVCNAEPDIFNHNIETVKRLTPTVRPDADYDRSLRVLKWVSENHPSVKVKSGLMVGLGEREEEVVETLKDLCNVGASIVTIGQYLRPARDRLPVADFIEPKVFEKYKVIGEEIGIKYVFSGPFVRSSYLAEEVFRSSGRNVCN